MLQLALTKPFTVIRNYIWAKILLPCSTGSPVQSYLRSRMLKMYTQMTIFWKHYTIEHYVQRKT